MNCGEKSLGRKRRRSRKWRKKTRVEGVDVELRFGKHDEEAREAFWKGMVATLEMVTDKVEQLPDLLQYCMVHHVNVGQRWGWWFISWLVSSF